MIISLQTFKPLSSITPQPKNIPAWLLFSEKLFVAVGVVVACGLKGRLGY